MGGHTTEYMPELEASVGGANATCEFRMSDTIAQFLQRIDEGIRANAMALLLVAVIVLVTAALLVALGRMGMSVLASYRRNAEAAPPMGSQRKQQRELVEQQVLDKDDNVDDPTVAVDEEEDDAQDGPREVSLIKAALGRVTAQYAAYNRAISEHATRIGESTDDGVVDTRIASAADDDWATRKPKD